MNVFTSDMNPINNNNNNNLKRSIEYMDDINNNKKSRARGNLWDLTANNILDKPIISMPLLPQSIIPQVNLNPQQPDSKLLQLSTHIQQQQIILAAQLAKYMPNNNNTSNAFVNQPSSLNMVNPLISPGNKINLERRIYVGSLQYNITEDIIRGVFQPFGIITKIDMPKETGATKSKGFCFVEFATIESSIAALITMNGVPLCGRAMKIGRPAGVIDDLNNPQAQKLIQSLPINIITNPSLNPALLAPNNTSTNSVVAPVTNSSTPLNLLNPATSSKCRIYIGSVAWDINEEHLRSIFEPFGSIRGIQLMQDTTTGKHKGYGFLEYTHEKSAADAIQTMNGFELCGRNLKVNYAANNTNIPLTIHNNNNIPPIQPNIFQNNIPVPSIIPNTNANQSLSMNPAAAAILAAAQANISSNSNDLSISREENLRISSHIQRSQLMQKLARSGRESNVILLKNLVSVNEVDNELEGEVASECSNYGAVSKVKIHIDRVLDKVYIYVLFNDIQAASRAVDGLNGRYFGGKVVAAEFYPKVKFDAGIFSDVVD